MSYIAAICFRVPNVDVRNYVVCLFLLHTAENFTSVQFESNYFFFQLPHESGSRTFIIGAVCAFQVSVRYVLNVMCTT